MNPETNSIYNLAKRFIWFRIVKLDHSFAKQSKEEKSKEEKSKVEKSKVEKSKVEIWYNGSAV